MIAFIGYVNDLNKLRQIYGIRRFVTAFTRPVHLYLFWTRRIQATLRQPISWRPILILYPYTTVFQLLSFPHVSSPNPFMYFLLFHMYYMLCPSYACWFDNSKNLMGCGGGVVEIIKLLNKKSPTFSCYLFPFRPTNHTIHSSVKELITVKMSWYILYTLRRQCISTQNHHLETNNIKCLKHTVHNCVENTINFISIISVNTKGALGNKIICVVHIAVYNSIYFKCAYASLSYKVTEFNFIWALKSFGAICSFHWGKKHKISFQTLLSSHSEETNEKFLWNICMFLWNYIAPDPRG